MGSLPAARVGAAGTETRAEAGASQYPFSTTSAVTTNSPTASCTARAHILTRLLCRHPRRSLCDDDIFDRLPPLPYSSTTYASGAAPATRRVRMRL